MPKWLKLCLVFAVIAAALGGSLILYAPGHWMTEKRNFASVTIDGRNISVDAYLGNPTTNEADAFLLVHIPDEGNFLLNFDDEAYREISNGQFIRLYRGVFVLKRMDMGPWATLLPFLHTDEFRLVSQKRHTVVIRF